MYTTDYSKLLEEYHSLCPEIMTRYVHYRLQQAVGGISQSLSSNNDKVCKYKLLEEYHSLCPQIMTRYVHYRLQQAIGGISQSLYSNNDKVCTLQTTASYWRNITVLVLKY